jgi:PhzF family phenazine biosynthesis protein
MRTLTSANREAVEALSYDIAVDRSEEISMLVYHVDAFTKSRFAGNPAAVCLLAEPCDASFMHAVAREMHLPKTSFVVRAAHGDVFHLRWFGPDGESSLCGHGTLATAHVLWESGQARPTRAIRFLTLAGELEARQLRGGWIEMDFPAEPAQATTHPQLAAALGVEPRWIGRNRIDYLVEVENESIVRAITPDFRRLEALLPPARGVIVTSRSGESSECDFVSRRFAPTIGLDEDPVTGSAHCALGPYWSTILGKAEFTARQLSPRGGLLRVRVGGERVQLAGQAVSVMRGQFFDRNEARG